MPLRRRASLSTSRCSSPDISAANQVIEDVRHMAKQRLAMMSTPPVLLSKLERLGLHIALRKQLDLLRRELSQRVEQVLSYVHGMVKQTSGDISRRNVEAQVERLIQSFNKAYELTLEHYHNMLAQNPKYQTKVHVLPKDSGLKHASSDERPTRHRGSARKSSGSERKMPRPPRKRRAVAGDRRMFGAQIKQSLLDWLHDNMTHPYPTVEVKGRMSERTGLSVSQICNFFINNRLRVWRDYVADEVQRCLDLGLELPSNLPDPDEIRGMKVKDLNTCMPNFRKILDDIPRYRRRRRQRDPF